MSILGVIIVNATYILFPFTIYLIYSAYTKNIDKNEKSIMLEITIYSSLYLLIRFGNLFTTIYPTLLLNIPLLISMIKNKKITTVIISVALTLFNYYNCQFNLFFLIIEYLSYIISIYIFNNVKNRYLKIINSFLIIKIIFIAYQTVFSIIPSSTYLETIIYVLTSSSLLVIFSYFIMYIINISESIVNYNSTLSELNREKALRNALFKITHEVKNPLAVCRGYLDMIEDKENCNEYLPVISKEINRTLNLMDDFLDYTKIKIEKEDTDICLLLEDIREEIMPLLKKNNIKGEFFIPDDELYLDLDYSRIKQVFINIYKNSIEAKNDNMKITLNVYRKNDQLIIKVSDNGIGMTQDTLNHIGENFYTTKQNGTGLGVSLSKEIITLHNGKMYYESTINKGTDVFIELPVK